MKTTRRTEIVFERDRTIVYPNRYPHRLMWCDRCDSEVHMITLFDAARLAAVSTDTIHAQIGDRSIHAWTPPEGACLVCLNSLLTWSTRSEYR